MNRPAKWKTGMQKLGPGVYAKDGAIHLDAAEICAHLGLPYTAANARRVKEEAAEAAREAWGQDIPVEERDEQE